MQSEVTSTARSALPGRAGIALLTLQLRAALQTAEAAEADAVGTDHSAAREQLRARLEPLMEERRRVLDAALAQTWADASAEVAAAERAAAVMVAQAAKRVSVVAPPVERVLTPVAEVEEVVEQEVVEEKVVEEKVVEHVAEEKVVEAIPAPVAEVEAEVEDVVEAVVEPDAELVVPVAGVAVSVDDVWRRPSPMAADEPGALVPGALPTTVVIDAEGFARVFATVLASLLDERLAAWGPGMRAIPVPTPAPLPAPVKQSFWTHARHPDVLLMGLTMVIVLVVLAAWLA